MAAKKKKAKKIAKKTSKKSPVSKKPAAKKAAAKAAKASKARVSVPPTSGQSGPPLKLTKEGLNDKELRVLTVLTADLNPLAINALATTSFPEQTTAKANSWVRNSLRRLVRGSWVEKVGKGTYRPTDSGRSVGDPRGAEVSPESEASSPQPA
jgi:hypothetical protein